MSGKSKQYSCRNCQGSKKSKKAKKTKKPTKPTKRTKPTKPTKSRRSKPEQKENKSTLLQTDTSIPLPNVTFVGLSDGTLSLVYETTSTQFAPLGPYKLTPPADSIIQLKQADTVIFALSQNQTLYQIPTTPFNLNNITAIDLSFLGFFPILLAVPHLVSNDFVYLANENNLAKISLSHPTSGILLLNDASKHIRCIALTGNDKYVISAEFENTGFHLWLYDSGNLTSQFIASISQIGSHSVKDIKQVEGVEEANILLLAQASNDAALLALYSSNLTLLSYDDTEQLNNVFAVTLIPFPVPVVFLAAGQSEGIIFTFFIRDNVICRGFAYFQTQLYPATCISFTPDTNTNTSTPQGFLSIGYPDGQLEIYRVPQIMSNGELVVSLLSTQVLHFTAVSINQVVSIPLIELEIS